MADTDTKTAEDEKTRPFRETTALSDKEETPQEIMRREAAERGVRDIRETIRLKD